MTHLPRPIDEIVAEFEAQQRRDRRRMLAVFFVFEAVIAGYALWIWWAR